MEKNPVSQQMEIARTNTVKKKNILNCEGDAGV
jgi:hypothetical protein